MTPTKRTGIRLGPLWDSRISAAVREIAAENLWKRFAILDRQLGDQPLSHRDTFSVADAYVYAMNWMKIHNIEMSRWPRLVASWTGLPLISAG
jgi:glutathione S-transferase